jgi:DNA-binding MarR family transcriptional regulator
MAEIDQFIPTLHQWIEFSMRRSMRNLLRYAKENELSMSQFAVLFHLSRRRSRGVTELGDHLGVTCAAASQLLERLVKQGLILRSEDPNDRRVKQIVLTDKGYQVLEEGIRARQDWLADLAGNLSSSEKEQVMGALNLLIEKSHYLGQPIESEN